MIEIVLNLLTSNVSIETCVQRRKRINNSVVEGIKSIHRIPCRHFLSRKNKQKIENLARYERARTHARVAPNKKRESEKGRNGCGKLFNCSAQLCIFAFAEGELIQKAVGLFRCGEKTFKKEEFEVCEPFSGKNNFPNSLKIRKRTDVKVAEGVKIGGKEYLSMNSGSSLLDRLIDYLPSYVMAWPQSSAKSRLFTLKTDQLYTEREGETKF